MEKITHTEFHYPQGHIRDAVRAIPPPTAFADDITTHGIKRKEPGSGSVVHSSEESDEICVIPNTPEQKRQRQSWGMYIQKNIDIC